MRKVAVNVHVIGATDDSQPLAGSRDQVVDVELLVPEREVVVVGDNHHHGRIEQASHVWVHAVLQQQLHRLDRIAVLVPGSFFRLELVEDLIHLGERPGAHGLPMVVYRHRHVAARLAGGAPLTILLDERAETPEPVSPVDPAHVLVAVHHAHDRDHRLNAPVESSDDQRVATAVGDSPDADPVGVDLRQT